MLPKELLKYARFFSPEEIKQAILKAINGVKGNLQDRIEAERPWVNFPGMTFTPAIGTTITGGLVTQTYTTSPTTFNYVTYS